MGSPYLAEITIVSFNFAPKNWAQCNGQLLSINSNLALFALLGTTYGGDGRTTFGLPNLQSRVPMHFISGHTLGEVGGEQNHTLVISELPSHTHVVNAGPAATSASPSTSTVPGVGTSSDFYGSGGSATLGSQSVTTVGGSQAHLNMQPFLTLNFIISLAGIFPSQS
jgi:microcystin-dependent protein